MLGMANRICEKEYAKAIRRAKDICWSLTSFKSLVKSAICRPCKHSARGRGQLYQLSKKLFHLSGNEPTNQPRGVELSRTPFPNATEYG